MEQTYTVLTISSVVPLSWHEGLALGRITARMAGFQIWLHTQGGDLAKVFLFKGKARATVQKVVKFSCQIGKPRNHSDILRARATVAIKANYIRPCHGPDPLDGFPTFFSVSSLSVQ